MRVSIRQDDPGYKQDAYMFEVLLNGNMVQDCFTADEEKGEAHVYVTNVDGSLQLDDDTGLPREMVLHGTVRVRRKESGNG